MADVKRISDFEDYRDFVVAVTQELLAHPRADFPSIIADPGICGGAARLIRTRIPVWTLERMRQLGVSEADILHGYPSLRAADLVQAWAYVASHRDEIEQAMREQEEA
jgi:uncharacterized protein (DUF433 family)